jgi:hypothetical protein
MKSAGDKRDLSKEPIKNAINAVMITVDSGYRAAECDVADGTGIVPTSALVTPSGSSFCAPAGFDDVDSGGWEAVVNRDSGFGYEWKNPRNPPEAVRLT